MKYLLITILLTFQNFTQDCNKSNFEGVIIYHRLLEGELNAKETYYFSNCRVRIDSEFYLDGGIQKYSSIYRFNSEPSASWKLDEQTTNKYIKKPLIKNSLMSSKQLNEEEKVLNYTTQKIVHEYETPLVEEITYKTSQYFWLADELKFELEFKPNNTPYMIPFNEGKIALKLIEVGTNDLTESSYSYERIAVEVKAMALDDELFEVD